MTPPTPPTRRVIKVGTSLLRGTGQRNTEAVIAGLAASLSRRRQQGRPSPWSPAEPWVWAAMPWDSGSAQKMWWPFRRPPPWARAG